MAYIGNTPVAGAFKKLDSISSSFNGALLTFPLTVLGIAQSVGTPQNVIISISGIIQEPVTAFSISGSNIIFTGAPLATDTFFGIVLGNVGILNGPSDGTVTSSSFAANAITNSLGFVPYNQANTLNTPTGAAIASASSINLSTATGNIVHITGTTTINTVVLASGFRTVVFDGVLTLTHNAVTNKLPGGVSITTAVGDVAFYESDGTTVFCTNYVKAISDTVTLAGIQTLTNKTITETVFAVTGTTPALTATNGAVQTWTLTAASTPTSALTSGQSIILQITPGAFSITWPSVVFTKVGGSGVAPTLFSAGKTTIVLFRIGTVLYGSTLGDTV